MASPVPTLVFVVCHPDDEALWAGALLAGLSSAGLAACHVICLSGAGSEREPEFGRAREIAGYAGAAMLEAPMGPADRPLPDVQAATRTGLDQLGLSIDGVDLLVSHSPYGDEHCHPHHVQAYRELASWAEGPPFACFSQVPFPFVAHKQRLRSIPRSGELQVVEMAHCSPTPFVLARLRLALLGLQAPHMWIRFAGSAEVKRRMLSCYESIDLEQHEAGYATFSNPSEGLYLYDRGGEAAMRDVVARMDAPGAADLFAATYPRAGLLGRLTKH
jgi:LmbE family N-acetylglucosaminyl deacetylase